MKEKDMKSALSAQKIEITEYHIYSKLAEKCKDAKNAEVLQKIANEEKRHAAYWQTKTGVTIRPNKRRVFIMVLLAKLFGLSFVLKQMEKNEGTGSKRYDALYNVFPEAQKIAEEERVHEKNILAMLHEEHLQYIGSIVLGLNDALVELTGSLAGFTLALGNTKVISLAGLVTGISAALSMAASDYLSSKAENDDKAGKSAIYTGIAYIITVVLLILPYLLSGDKFFALAVTLITAVLIIFCFNYYISVAKDLDFKRRFFEMTAISLSVAAFSFLVGYALKAIMGVDI